MKIRYVAVCICLLLSMLCISGCTQETPPKTETNPSTTAAPEVNFPEEYAVLLHDYSSLIAFRLSSAFEEDYNNNNLPQLSEMLQQSIASSQNENDLLLNWSNMIVEMTAGITNPSADDFGYIVADIDQDGTQELIWIRQDRTILALFTMNGEELSLIDAFSPKHVGLISAQGYLYTRSTGGADVNHYEVKTIRGTQVAAFGMDGSEYFEIRSNERQSIDQDTFSALLNAYPFQYGDKFAALPIQSLSSADSNA